MGHVTFVARPCALRVITYVFHFGAVITFAVRVFRLWAKLEDSQTILSEHRRNQAKAITTADEEADKCVIDVGEAGKCEFYVEEADESEDDVEEADKCVVDVEEAGKCEVDVEEAGKCVVDVKEEGGAVQDDSISTKVARTTIASAAVTTGDQPTRVLAMQSRLASEMSKSGGLWRCYVALFTLALGVVLSIFFTVDRCPEPTGGYMFLVFQATGGEHFLYFHIEEMGTRELHEKPYII